MSYLQFTNEQYPVLHLDRIINLERSYFWSIKFCLLFLKTRINPLLLRTRYGNTRFIARVLISEFLLLPTFYYSFNK